MLLWAWGPLEADFWRFYKIDLLVAGLGNQLSWRRFLVLVRGLPSDSAYQQWLANDDNRSLAGWSDEAIEHGIKATNVRKIRKRGGR